MQTKELAGQEPAEGFDWESLNIVDEMRSFVDELWKFFNELAKIYAGAKLTAEQKARVFQMQVEIMRFIVAYCRSLSHETEQELVERQDLLCDEMDLISDLMHGMQVEIDVFELGTLPEGKFLFKFRE